MKKNTEVKQRKQLTHLSDDRTTKKKKGRRREYLREKNIIFIEKKNANEMTDFYVETK